MSTICLSCNHFETVAYNAKKYQHRTVCNINYCNTLSLRDVEIEKWVIELCKLNEQSYCCNYSVPFDGYCNFLDFKNAKKDLNAYEMLKLLECIDYNIHQKSWAIDLLQKAISEIKSAIISDIIEYNNSPYCI